MNANMIRHQREVSGARGEKVFEEVAARRNRDRWRSLGAALRIGKGIASVVRAAKLAILLLPLPALAGTGFQIDGFGSLGLSCFSDASADFVYNALPEGPGHTRRCDAGIDSLVGVQADAAVYDGLDAVMQAVSQRGADKNFSPQLTIGNLRWKANDQITVRFGRINSPMFLESDYRLVRFALPTIRPPEAVYGLFPNFVVDGVDATRTSWLGAWRLQLYGGIHNSDFEAPTSGSDVLDQVRLRDSLTTFAALDRGPWTLKLSYNRSRVTYTPEPVEQLLAALRTIDPISPGAAALADQLDLRGTPFDLVAAAARYDSPSLLVEAEFARRHFHRSFYRDSEGFDILAGYRLGLWMPYALVERRLTWGPGSDSRAGPLAPEVDALLGATRLDASSFIAGVSREVSKNMTIKAEIQWLRRDAGSWAYYLTNQTPAFNLNSAAWDHLFSISLNFVL